MIKTEAERWILTNDIELSKDVRQALDNWNKSHTIKLDLLFDIITNKWQFYRIKKFGLTSDNDLLHWQISAPTEGTLITPGILDWLRQYDQSEGGYLDQDDLRKQWLQQWKDLQEKQAKQQKHRQDELQYGYKPIIDKLSVLREQISVPITVGFNKKTGKKVMAVPKGTGKLIKKIRRNMSG